MALHHVPDPYLQTHQCSVYWVMHVTAQICLAVSLTNSVLVCVAVSSGSVLPHDKLIISVCALLFEDCHKTQPAVDAGMSEEKKTCPGIICVVLLIVATTHGDIIPLWPQEEEQSGAADVTA